MYEDPCKDKNVKFLGEKPPILFSQHSSFTNKNKGDCKDQRRRNGPWKKSCVYSLVQIGFTLGAIGMQLEEKSEKYIIGRNLNTFGYLIRSIGW